VFLSQLAATSTEFIRAVRRVRSSFAPFLFLVWCPNHRLTPRHGAASFCRWGSRRRFEDWFRRTRELAPPHFSRFSLSLVITHLLNFLSVRVSRCSNLREDVRCRSPLWPRALPFQEKGKVGKHAFVFNIYCRTWLSTSSSRGTTGGAPASALATAPSSSWNSTATTR
jgi:hypothetical protein